MSSMALVRRELEVGDGVLDIGGGEVGELGHDILHAVEGESAVKVLGAEEVLGKELLTNSKGNRGVRGCWRAVDLLT